MTESGSRLIVTKMEHGGRVRQFCVLEENRRIVEIRVTALDTIPNAACENKENEKIKISKVVSSSHILEKDMLEEEREIKNNPLIKLHAAPRIGEVYIAQVETMPKNLEAAFVRIAPDVRCYLPLKETEHIIFASERRKLPLRPGDEILVQVTREAMGMKLPSVSCKISIPGQYMVIESGEPGISFSRKLTTQEKFRLEKMINKRDSVMGLPCNTAEKRGITEKPGITNSSYENPQNIGTPYKLIIRTNAAGATEQELQREYEYLAAEFLRITNQGHHHTLYSKLYESEPPYIDMLKNIRMDQLLEIVSDEQAVIQTLLSWTDIHAPELNSIIRQYEDPLLPLYKLIGLESTLTEMQHRIVWLKCGGFLVIEKTEAFVSIDVNSGKFTSKKKPEEAFRQVNLEAAEEAARQIRLRNLAGIILIDFINMKNPDHDEELMNVLRNHLKKDPLKAQVVDMTALHIVEVTRKKTGPTIESGTTALFV